VSSPGFPFLPIIYEYVMNVTLSMCTRERINEKKNRWQSTTKAKERNRGQNRNKRMKTPYIRGHARSKITEPYLIKTTSDGKKKWFENKDVFMMLSTTS
jgi:hypothetical protein